MTSYFFLRYQLWINYEGRVNDENDQQFQKSLIVNQIQIQIQISRPSEMLR